MVISKLVVGQGTCLTLHLKALEHNEVIIMNSNTFSPLDIDYRYISITKINKISYFT